MKKLGRGLVRKLVRTGIVLAVLGLVVLGTPKLLLYLQLRAARSEGLPLNPSEIEAQLSIAESKNAAPLYLKAGELLHQILLQERVFRAGKINFASLPDPARIKTNLLMLNHYGPAMQEAEVASLRPSISYDRPWSTGLHQLLPEFDAMRDLTILEVKSAGMLALRGDHNGALRAIETAERISNHLGSEPDLASNMSFAKTQMEIDRTVSELMSHVDRNPAFLSGLQSIYDKLPAPRPLSFYYRGQFVMDRSTIERLPEMSEDDYDELLAGLNEDSRPRMERLLKNGFLNPIFEANYISYYRDLIAKLPKDETNWEALKTASLAADQAANTESIQNCATSAVSKPLYIYAVSQERLIANRRLLVLSLRLLQLEQHGKQLPKTMPDFGPLGINPFTGKPFNYARDAQGFVLSGAGPVGEVENLVLRVGSLSASTPPSRRT